MDKVNLTFQFITLSLNYVQIFKKLFFIQFLYCDHLFIRKKLVTK